MVTRDAFKHMIEDGEEAFARLAEVVYQEFLTWLEQRPDFQVVYDDLSLVNQVLEDGIVGRMTPLQDKQAAAYAACRLRELAQQSDVLYNFSLVQLFECLSCAWSQEIGG